MSHKDNCNVVLGWMSIDKLAELTSNPDFIKEMVNEMDASPQHVITGLNRGEVNYEIALR